jgi:hypothetical protein
MLGQSIEGLRELERAYATDPRPNYLCYVAWARARSGDTAGVRRILDQLREQEKKSFVQPYVFAIVYSSLGETDSAFAYLERGIALRSEEQCDIKVNVALDPLRSDPRYGDILRRMNLGPSQRPQRANLPATRSNVAFLPLLDRVLEFRPAAAQRSW